MLRIMLVHMPCADCNRPSLGLSLLKAGLTRAGMSCNIVYLNDRFAKMIGHHNYMQINEFSSSSLLGEWIFSEALFGESMLPDAEAYYGAVLRPSMLDPLGGNEEAFKQQVVETELFNGLIALRSQAGQFIDNCYEEYDWNNYDVVGFGTTFHQNVAALALAKRIKAASSGTVIAFGGANCESIMGVTMHRLFPFIDVVCSGEGDRAFIDYVKAYAAGKTTPLVDGIIQRSRGKTILPTSLANPIHKMDDLPIPDFKDFFQQCGLAQEERHPVRLPIESSRGCWWGEKAHCTFCGLNGGTMTYRTKSADRFLSEVSTLANQYGVRHFAASDNIIDLQYFQTVLPRLTENNLGVRLFYETKANLQAWQVRMLRESGVTHIQPGIESLSTKVLSLMRKGVLLRPTISLDTHLGHTAPH